MTVTTEEIQVSPACKRLSITWTCDCGCGTTVTHWSAEVEKDPAWVVVLGTKGRRKHDKSAFHFVDLDHLKAWARRD